MALTLALLEGASLFAAVLIGILGWGHPGLHGWGDLGTLLAQSRQLAVVVPV